MPPQNGPPPKLNKWAFRGALLLVDIVNNRYCNNIGREHKSNGVYYVINTATMTHQQRCHDPDCAGYRSPRMCLPDEVADELRVWISGNGTQTAAAGASVICPTS